MSEQGFQERTEQATPRRQQKAREEGKVAKSPEVNSAAMLGFGFLTLLMLGPRVATQIMHMMQYTMTNAPTIAGADATFVTIFGDYAMRFFLTVSPVFVVLGVVALAVNVAQVGFHITPKAIEPKLDKLNIVSGLKRLVSVTSLVNLVKDCIKLLIVGVVAYKAIEGEFESFFLLPDMTVADLAISMGKLSVKLGLKIAAVMVIIAALDFAYKKYEFEKSIKMSKQDLKEEYKETDGSPQLKGKIKQLQRQMSQQRMMQAVPLADVVVTNPIHLAVALKYDSEAMTAPQVLAKGERLVAEKIKQIARENDIPVVEDKPLARSLFKLCDVGDFVPETLYRAVAELLAYIYRLKGRTTVNG
ncbi:MAG: flagellar biosynthesis protein FlhB [bacterium]